MKDKEIIQNDRVWIVTCSCSDNNSFIICDEKEGVTYVRTTEHLISLLKGEQNKG